MARQIIITGSAPIRLSTLVATSFMDCQVLSFQLKDTELHYLFIINPKALSENEIARNLKNKFRFLKDQGLWSPAESKKVDTEVDLDSLKLSVCVALNL